jgi:hypothetical protein
VEHVLLEETIVAKFVDDKLVGGEVADVRLFFAADVDGGEEVRLGARVEDQVAG